MEKFCSYCVALLMLAACIGPDIVQAAPTTNTMLEKISVCPTVAFVNNSSYFEFCRNVVAPTKYEEGDVAKCMILYDITDRICIYQSIVDVSKSHESLVVPTTSQEFDQNLKMMEKKFDQNNAVTEVLCQSITSLFKKLNDMHTQPLVEFKQYEDDYVKNSLLKKEECAVTCHSKHGVDKFCMVLFWANEVFGTIKTNKNKNSPAIDETSLDKNKDPSHISNNKPAKPDTEPESKGQDAGVLSPPQLSDKKLAEENSAIKVTDTKKVEEDKKIVMVTKKIDKEKKENLDQVLPAVVNEQNKKKSPISDKNKLNPNVDDIANSEENLEDINAAEEPQKNKNDDILKNDDEETLLEKLKEKEGNKFTNEDPKTKIEDPVKDNDQDEEEKMNDKENRIFPGEDQALSGATRKSTEPKRDESYIMYFFILVCCTFMYFVYSNKQKIVAMFLEGRRGRRGRGNRKRASSASYRRLDSNLEEAVTSQCNANVTNVIY